MNDAVIQELAVKYKVTPAQICIAWALQRGTSVVVKSVSRQHQEENWYASKIILDDEDMKVLAQLDRRYRFFRPEEWWSEAVMAVFD
jgi:alcohol dehydrogenase (NADP+)